MLNRVILMGRIVNDLEIRTTSGGASVLSFTVAVDRSFVRQGEERQSDFIDCVAWNQRAEFINKYFSKGRMIAVEGNLQTRSYDDRNGVRRKAVEVMVDNVSFTGEKAQQSSGDSYGYQSRNEQYSRSPEPPKQQQNSYREPDNRPISIGGLDDFEEILSDDGVPF